MPELQREVSALARICRVLGTDSGREVLLPVQDLMDRFEAYPGIEVLRSMKGNFDTGMPRRGPAPISIFRSPRKCSQIREFIRN